MFSQGQRTAELPMPTPGLDKSASDGSGKTHSIREIFRLHICIPTSILRSNMLELKQEVCLISISFFSDDPFYLGALSCGIDNAAKVNEWRSSGDLPLPDFLAVFPRVSSVPGRDKEKLATAVVYMTRRK